MEQEYLFRLRAYKHIGSVLQFKKGVTYLIKTKDSGLHILL